MSLITKIRNIVTARLNHAEFLAFMTGVRKLITKATPEKLMTDSETLAAFDTGLNQLTDLMIKLRGSEETAQMAELDYERDRLQLPDGHSALRVKVAGSRATGSRGQTAVVIAAVQQHGANT